MSNSNLLRILPVFAIVSVSVAASVGCAVEGTEDESQDLQDVATSDDPLAAAKLLDCKNTAGTTTLALTAGARGIAKGALKQVRARGTFACTPGATPNSFSCAESSGAGVRGSIAITVAAGGAIQASIATSARFAADTLACTAPAPVAAAGLLYRDLAPVISANCSGCHGAAARTPLATLAQVKTKKVAMESLVSSGRMPAGRPTWGASADGQKLLTWLRTGADL